MAAGDCTIINTRDKGSLKIVKAFNPKTSGYDTAFNIDYKCGDDPKQTVAVKAGESKTIDGIPTGTECTVSEVKPTDPPTGWSFSDADLRPGQRQGHGGEKGQTVTVTVTNEILKPGIKIVKTASATQVNPGETVTYTYTVDQHRRHRAGRCQGQGRQVHAGDVQVRRHQRRRQAADQPKRGPTPERR